MHRSSGGASLLWIDARRRVEDRLVGPVEEPVRYNMRAELASALANGAFMTILAFIPLLLRRLGGSPEVLALCTASVYLGNVLSPLGLYFVRPGQVKRTVAFLWLVARAAFLAAGFVTGDIGLLLVVAFFWFFDQLPAPMYSFIIQRVYPASERGKVMAVVRVGMGLSTLALTPVAGWVLDRAGYRTLFPVAAAAGIVAALLFLRLRVDESASTIDRTRIVNYAGRILRRDRRFTLYLVALAFFGFSSLMPMPLYPLVQADRLGLSYLALGWLSLLFTFSRLVTYFYWGRRIDRWGSVRCLQIAFLLNVVVVSPFIVASQAWMLIPSYLAQGAVNSALDLGYVTAAIQLAAPKHIAEYAALQFVVIGLRGMLGPLIGVSLLRVGLSQTAVFGLSIVMALVAAAILGGVNRRQPQLRAT